MVSGVEVVERSAVDGSGLLLLLVHGSGQWVHILQMVGALAVNASGANVAGVVGEAHAGPGVEAGVGD